MKNYQNKFLKFITFSFICISLFSCSKKETITDIITTPTDSSASFTWTENGGATIKADSAYWTTGAWGTGIRASKGSGVSNYFEINWATQNNTSVGSKTLTVGSDFTFLQAGNTYTNPTDQLLNITGFSNDKLSGNCTVAVAGGTITTIVCTFSNLPKK
ncbi:MAG: hypothetical protein KA275_03810 [Chitinophagaceae bacterium]|nr:hypothetical protein [Chitinophagaceae bacterium]